MLEDRDYMRDDAYGGRWYHRLPMALWLVIANAVVYAAQLIVPVTTHVSLDTYLALQTQDILHGWVWQLLTFQFLHAGPLHLLINCAMLYMFGRVVEASLGRVRFLKLYFLSGAFGGLFQVGLSLLFRRHFGFIEGLGWPPVVGASAGIFGLIAAFAIMNREQPITMLLAFIFPVTLKAKYLLLVEAIMAGFGLFDTTSGVAHGAHMGGMIMGVLYVTQIMDWHWPGRTRSPQRSSPRELVSASGKARGWRSPPLAEDEPLSAQEFLRREVDPILEKISAHGIHSLTDKERKTLEAARKKMSGGR